MKTIKLTLMIITLCTWCGYSQSIEKFSIDSGGAATSAGGLQILYVIGEVNVAEQISGDLSISEGFITGGLLPTLDVNDVEVSAFQINIYPNPASDVLHVSSSERIDHMELFSVLGEKVKQNYNSDEITVKGLSTGIYLLKVFNNNRYITKKVVIK
ncbi:hypothetical protein JCM19274_746 [Algibacter lectus]|uniref:Secretion system C-terminal sorting domain-containing protein n=1 Tax=Algibacter lectus TaxID=221126 RepID=A0A090WTX5_9FLAO|nr:T9SS type A sorting domain-containing protein [Algibacter lectus]GAL80456.1 hypothetical protein JCM19274_746 [Algibacter lectus]